MGMKERIFGATAENDQPHSKKDGKGDAAETTPSETGQTEPAPIVDADAPAHTQPSGDSQPEDPETDFTDPADQSRSPG